jgi:hypothetical protein
MSKLTNAVLASALVFGASQALANEEGKSPAIDPTVKEEMKPSFDTVDTNNDESVTQGEAQTHPELNRLFASLDLNSDQKLSRAEFSEFLNDDEEEEAE